MGAENRGVNAKLNPAHIDLGVEGLCLDGGGAKSVSSCKMSAQIMAPCAKESVCSLCGESGLEGQRVPIRKGIATEARWISPGTDAAVAAENHRPAIRPACHLVLPVEVIQPAQRIEPLHRSLATLLPVHPPKVDSAFLLGMMQVAEVGRHVVGVCAIEGNACCGRRIMAEVLAHG